MAFKAKDGTPYTNKPQASAHDARMQRVPADQSAHEEKEKGMISELGAMHGMSVTCPACGHDFTPSEATEEISDAGGPSAH